MVLSCHLVLCFFFSSRRRHTISYGDWSSDVCSSDLHERPRWGMRLGAYPIVAVRAAAAHAPATDLPVRLAWAGLHFPETGEDRKSVVEGKSKDISGRVCIRQQ